MGVEEINKFSTCIESLMKEKRISAMDAVLLYCEKNDLEIESAASLISSVLKAKIRVEAENLNFIKPSTTTQLPL